MKPIEDADTNVQRIHVRHPGGKEHLFVEQRFTRRDRPLRATQGKDNA